ncbi:hypothetical protein BDN67DRAFT_985061 [Paxillus ammoniavirescens]|nr:hypothetical protein BDN67DRAFT_985061 [Paxillus ammoniavirescens]
MSAIIALQTLLDQSASIIEGVLHDLEWESEADHAMAETWTHVNNLIYEEMVMVWSRLENAPTVRVPPILIATHLNIQTVVEIRETQQWPPLLELHGTTDGIYAHPWSQLHLLGTAGTLPPEAIKRLGSSTAAVPQMVPSAMKVEPGEVEMGEARSTEKGKGKVKARDTGDEIVREGKAKGKGKEKEKKVGEDMVVEKSKGKGKGKGKEVVEAMMEKGILKNKGKGRKSSKDMGQARGRSKSMVMSRYKSAEVVPTDSEDEGTGLPPKGPSLTPLSVQSAAQKARAKSTKRGRSASRPPAKSTALRQQSQAPPPLKKSQLGELHPMAGPSRPRQERFDGVVMPLLSRSFARSSIPPARQSMQPDDGLSPLLVSKDKEIATLQAQVWILEQKVADWMRNTQALTTMVEALHRQGPHHQHPLPPYPFDLALYIGDTDSPSSPTPRDSTAIADGSSAAQIPSGEAASARVHPPPPESPRSSAPQIAVLSPATTPSSGLDIAMMPEVDTRQPSPAAVAAAQPNINTPVDAGPAPSVLGPMEDVQASPDITIIDVDAVVDVDATQILMANGTVTAAEAEGDPDLPTAPALPSPQQPAAALQALTAMYEDKEDMESAAQKARAKSTKHGRSASRPPAKSTAVRQQSQAPPPLKKSQLGELHPMAGPSRPRQERFDGVVMPLLSRSFARSSIPPARQSMQPDDGLSPLPVSKDKEIATLQVQVWILEQKVADWMRNTQALTTMVEALHRQGPHHQHPLLSYPFDLALYIGDTDSPSSPAPRDSTAIADGSSATQIPSGEAASARVHPPPPESPRSSAPQIAVLSPATTPSSGLDIAMMPEVDTQQPSPAAVAAAQPNINTPVDVGPAPSVLGPMEDVQASPDITIIDVDAVVDIDATQILMANGTVTAAEAEGDPDLPTAPALPSPQQPAAALQALTAMYEDKEDMEVDD